MLFKKSEKLDYKYDVVDTEVEGLMVLPLYGSMTSERQRRIFSPVRSVPLSLSLSLCFSFSLSLSLCPFFIHFFLTWTLGRKRYKESGRVYQHCCHLPYHWYCHNFSIFFSSKLLKFLRTCYRPDQVCCRFWIRQANPLQS